jgi:dienelactone hydrolase
MTTFRHRGLIAMMLVAAASPSLAAETPPTPHGSAALRVLSEPADGGSPRRMMYAWLRQKAKEALDRRDQTLAQLRTPADCRAYQARMRRFFLDKLGELPDRTPLNARVIEKIERPTFRVEKVLFESQPGFFVSAALFLPKSAGPYPAVLVSCGHSVNGKALATYQEGCILLAEHGMAALIYDPIGQGERRQMLKPDGSILWQAAMDHLFGGQTSMLVGQNIARYMIWDGMRAIDYLQSRGDILSKRVGAAGNSGGGTLTAYLWALDERIAAATPSCFITHFRSLLSTGGPGDCEQDIHGQLHYGLGYAEYLTLRAPCPALICAARNDYFPFEGAQQTLAEAKSLYGILDAGERVALTDAPGPHGWSPPLQKATVGWMLRWLGDRSTPVAALRGKALSDAEIQCTPRGQVLLLPGARSLYDLTRDVEKRLAQQRQRLWSQSSREQICQQVRRLAGIRPLESLSEPQLERCGTVAGGSHQVEKLLIRPEPGIVLPALLATPKGAMSGKAWLAVGEIKEAILADPAGPMRQRLVDGDTVLVVDLRGVNETKRTDSPLPEVFAEYFDTDWEDVILAYLLGKSYVGMRAEDVLVCARWLGRQSQAKSARVHLWASDSLGPAALHANFLEPQLFASAEFVRFPASWSQCVQHPECVRRWSNTVHGALGTYDLPDLLRWVKPQL